MGPKGRASRSVDPEPSHDVDDSDDELHTESRSPTLRIQDVQDLFAGLRRDFQHELKSHRLDVDKKIQAAIGTARDGSAEASPTGDDSDSAASGRSRQARRASSPTRRTRTIERDPTEERVERSPAGRSHERAPTQRLALYGGDDDDGHVHPDEQLPPTTRQIVIDIREGGHRPLPLPYDHDNPFPRDRPFRAVAMHYDSAIAGDAQSAKLDKELQAADAGLLGSGAKLELRTLIPALSALHDLRASLSQPPFGDDTRHSADLLQQADAVDTLLRERLTLLSAITTSKAAYQATTTCMFNAEATVSSRETMLSSLIAEQAATKAFSRHVTATSRALDDTSLPAPKPTTTSSRAAAAGLRRTNMGQRGGGGKGGGTGGGDASGGTAAPPQSAPPPGAHAKYGGRGGQGGRGAGGHVPP